MPTAECDSLPPKTIYDDCKDRGALLLVEFFGTDIKKKKSHHFKTNTFLRSVHNAKN